MRCGGCPTSDDKSQSREGDRVWKNECTSSRQKRRGQSGAGRGKGIAKAATDVVAKRHPLPQDTDLLNNIDNNIFIRFLEFIYSEDYNSAITYIILNNLKVRNPYINNIVTKREL